ncbi:dihydrodipicolinate synthase family protein [Caproicibacter fermentans]|uniref:Dihydrodipicolinate synthase family protein n=1 Tax=Caproicibacter fermentans TaxID=2576756 RepID=A0A7G8T801_9FIRM|nr:dihydrodipicolinate synthase family protein [Caproicibacter fermentans]QNK39742.1 dihydrodipicolinate synthase family protein [Caproicibacter fermentans]
MAYFEITGVFPPVITPFHEDESVDYDSFTANLEKWNRTGLAGYLILGSNSETPYLTEEEKLGLVRLAKQHKAQDKLLMVGTGLESTEATVRLTNLAADAGADAALVLTPGFYGAAMGDDAQYAFFTEVADRSKIPVLLYNVPKFTHINLTPSVVSRLSRHPNIIGMKDSSGDIGRMTALMTEGLDSEFNLLVGTASVWYPALALGIRGGVMALCNCAPRECAEIQTLFDAGKYQEALKLNKKMFPVNAAVTGAFGVPGLKYACDLVGYKGGCPRKPLLPLTQEKKDRLEQILKSSGLV